MIGEMQHTWRDRGAGRARHGPEGGVAGQVGGWLVTASRGRERERAWPRARAGRGHARSGAHRRRRGRERAEHRQRCKGGGTGGVREGFVVVLIAVGRGGERRHVPDHRRTRVSAQPCIFSRRRRRVLRDWRADILDRCGGRTRHATLQHRDVCCQPGHLKLEIVSLGLPLGRQSERG